MPYKSVVLFHNMVFFRIEILMDLERFGLNSDTLMYRCSSSIEVVTQ